MSRAVAASLVAVAAACTPDEVPFGIELVLDRGDTSYRCEVDSCEFYPMGCDALMLVRIVDADDPDTVYFSQCSRVDGGEGRVLCDLAEVDLDAVDVPNTMVRVRVAVWPALGLTTCPDVDFDLQGKPKSQIDVPMPALGGESFFEVGSRATAPVTLACVSPAELDTCASGALTVAAQVDDFDTNLPVADVFESRLDVSVGEPRFNNVAGQWVLDEEDTVELLRGSAGPVTEWTATFDPPFLDTVCVQVLERGIQATATLRCWDYQGVPADLRLEADGAFVDRQAIDQIIQAIGNIPEEGLVLGKVVDFEGQPASNVRITGTVDGGTNAVVRYLSDDLTSVVDGASATTSSGAFVSTEAAFNVVWTASNGTIREEAPVVGGQVEGKVTVVMLQLRDPDVKP